jgi:hypothetical protein
LIDSFKMNKIEIGKKYIHSDFEITIGSKIPYKGFEILEKIFCPEMNVCEKCDKSDVIVFNFGNGCNCLDCEYFWKNSKFYKEQLIEIQSLMKRNSRQRNIEYYEKITPNDVLDYYKNIKYVIYRKTLHYIIKDSHILNAFSVLFRNDTITLLSYKYPQKVITYCGLIERDNEMIINFESIQQDYSLNISTSIGKSYYPITDCDDTLYLRYGINCDISRGVIQRHVDHLSDKIISAALVNTIDNNECKCNKAYITHTTITVTQKESEQNMHELEWIKYYDSCDINEIKELESEYIGEEFIDLVGGIMDSPDIIFIDAIISYVRKFYGTLNCVCSICKSQTDALYMSCCHKCFILNRKNVNEVRYDVYDIIDANIIINEHDVIHTLEKIINNTVTYVDDDKLLQEYNYYQKRKQCVMLKLAIMFMKTKYMKYSIQPHFFHYYKPDSKDIKCQIATNYSLYFLQFMINNNFGKKFPIDDFKIEEQLIDRRYDMYGSIHNIKFMIEIDDKSHDTEYGKLNDELKTRYCIENNIKLFRIDTRDYYKSNCAYTFFQDRYDRFEIKFRNFIKCIVMK